MSGSSGNIYSILANPTVVNPLQAIGTAVNTAKGITDLRTGQFDLQQKQNALGYQAMRMLAATNEDPSDADVNAALGSAARMGGNNTGNIDGIVQNYSDWRARGGTAKDFVRAYSLGGMTPENQVNYGLGLPASQDTGAGTLYGVRGGALSSTPGAFTPAGGAPLGFVQSTLSPAVATDMVQVGTNPDGSAKMVPRWQIQGSGAPGVGPAGVGSAPGGGGGAGGGGGPAQQPQGAPPGSNIQPGTPMSQKDADLARFAQRESGNQNIYSNVQVPGYTKEQTGSGYYQIIPSTWAEGQQLAGIPPQQRTQTAIQASSQQQYAVASALYDKYGGRPWALSAPGGGNAVAAAPGGGGGGPFIGAASAQPVVGGGAVATLGGSGGAVRPAGGGGVPVGDPYGRLVVQGGGGGGGPAPGGGGGMPPGGYGGYSGLPLGAGNVVAGNIQRQQALEQQMNAAVSTRATLEGMEAELAKMPPTGVASGALSTIKNLLVQSFGLSQKELDRQAQGLAAQEQFEKFSAMLNQQLLSGMGGQATDARQELTGAATPSSVHSTLGNMGIIHMLEGNLVATQVMGREFAAAVRAGQASPQQFDQWRDDFTKVGPNGARFDPRVFWLSQMGPKEQQAYVNSLTDKDKAQLLKNSNYAEQKGWVFENKDGSMGTGY